VRADDFTFTPSRRGWQERLVPRGMYELMIVTTLRELRLDLVKGGKSMFTVTREFVSSFRLDGVVQSFILSRHTDAEFALILTALHSDVQCQRPDAECIAQDGQSNSSNANYKIVEDEHEYASRMAD
jgi:hypothetical protein